MTIGNISVLRSEFEAFYNKNLNVEGEEKHTFDEYVEMYVAYKLKVAEALSRGIDTTQAFKEEFDVYCKQLLESMQDQSYWQDSLLNETQHRIGQEVKASHILLMVDGNAPDSLVEAKKAQIEDIKIQIENGASFEELAKQYSEDPSGKANGGDLGYFRLFQMVYPFEDAAYSTPVGGMTICRSRFGFHLIKVFDRRAMDLTNINPVVIDMIQNGVNAQMRGQLLNMFSNDTERMAKARLITEEHCPTDKIKASEEYQSLYREYHDGILLFDVANEAVWEKAANDREGLEKYFEANRDKYNFENPKFKGAFIECADDKALIDALKNIYDSHEMREAADLVRANILPDTLLTPNPRQPRFHIVNGLFKKGDNAAVDVRLGENKEVERRPDMPVQMTFGKVLNAPENVDDVKGEVISDYQDLLEKEFVGQLKKKFQVKLNKKELEKIKNGK